MGWLEKLLYGTREEQQNIIELQNNKNNHSFRRSSDKSSIEKQNTTLGKKPKNKYW